MIDLRIDRIHASDDNGAAVYEESAVSKLMHPLQPHTCLVDVPYEGPAVEGR